jgi:hypothetical protein
MAPPLRHRALRALRGVLALEHEALYTEAPDGAVACRPEVADAAWRLALLSRDLRDSELAVRARCCLLRSLRLPRIEQLP